MAKKLVSSIFPFKFLTNAAEPKLIKSVSNQADWDTYLSSVKSHSEEEFLNSHGMPTLKIFFLGSRGPGGRPLKDFLQK